MKTNGDKMSKLKNIYIDLLNQMCKMNMQLKW